MEFDHFVTSNLTNLSVNGLKLPVLEVVLYWHAPDDPYGPNARDEGSHRLQLVFERPEIAASLELGATVQVQLDHFDLPVSFRVTAVRVDEELPRKHAEWPKRVYVAELDETSRDLVNDQDQGTTEVLYQTVFMTAATRAQLDTIGQLLLEKSVITAQEYRDRLAATVQSSFLDFALDIVAEEEATAMRDVILSKLNENLDAMMPRAGAETEAAS